MTSKQKYLFFTLGHTIGFPPLAQNLYYYIEYKLNDVKVLLKSFHLNGHTKGLRPQT